MGLLIRNGSSYGGFGIRLFAFKFKNTTLQLLLPPLKHSRQKMPGRKRGRFFQLRQREYWSTKHEKSPARRQVNGFLRPSFDGPLCLSNSFISNILSNCLVPYFRHCETVISAILRNQALPSAIISHIASSKKTLSCVCVCVQNSYSVRCLSFGHVFNEQSQHGRAGAANQDNISSDAREMKRPQFSKLPVPRVRPLFRALNICDTFWRHNPAVQPANFPPHIHNFEAGEALPTVVISSYSRLDGSASQTGQKNTSKRGKGVSK